MDVLTKAQRSYNMSQIRGKNTKPEILLRKLLWAQDLRGYRLHTKITGRPDIYFPKKKVAVFIDGCFWHGCKKCFKMPKSNKSFWKKKISENIKRDKKVNLLLRKQGILKIRIWQHQIKTDPYLHIRKIRASFITRNKA